MTTRVLVVAEQLRRPVPGGIGTVTAGLLSGLSQLDLDGPGGVQPAVLASRPPRRSRRDGVDPLRRFGWPVVSAPFPSPLLTRAWDRGYAGPPGTFDVLHAVSLAVPPTRPPTAVVVTVHDLAWRHHPDATTRRGRRWHEDALRRALGRADAVIVPSDPVGDELVAAGLAPELLGVVPNGADHLPAPDGTAVAALLDALGVTGPFLLTAGTLEPRKNLARVLGAYEEARASLPEPWPLLVVGPRGWGDDGLGAALPPGVLVPGAVGPGVLAGLYARAHLFVYAPLTEGYGLPPLEAMRAGLPVVASATTPSIRPTRAEAVGPGSSGDPATIEVDPHDVGAIAAALVQGSSDIALRRRLATAGRTLAGRRTWRGAAAAVVARWRTLR